MIKKEHLVSTSEVADYLGIPKSRVKDYLDPVLGKDGKPYRVGREYAYLPGEIKKVKKEIETAKRKEEEVTLRPEDLSPQEKYILNLSAVLYGAINDLGEQIKLASGPFRENIEVILGGNEKYTGDDIVKSIYYGWSTRKEVNPETLLRYLPKTLLRKEGIETPYYDAKRLEKKGPELIKNRLKGILGKFEGFCKEMDISIDEADDRYLKEITNHFFKRHRTKIPANILRRMFKDYRDGVLSERRLGKYSRELIDSCITKVPTTRRLSIKLKYTPDKSIKKIMRHKEHEAPPLQLPDLFRTDI